MNGLRYSIHEGINMKVTGGYLVRYALEQIGVQFTFGIPGVHTTEIYDELDQSEKIQPILVTHEGGASFMADAISRTTDTIGTAVIVPGAGATHAASGIAEAYLDGIPTLIISGGVRRDTGKYYQLHQIDQKKLVEGMVKKYFLIQKHDEVIPTIYEAYQLAISGEPGPVFVEIASDILLLQGEIAELTKYVKPKAKDFDFSKIDDAIEILNQAKKIGIYAGWGARDAGSELIAIAEYFNAPVATTMQGLSVFPSNHPLHCGMGFGVSSVPASENAFRDCDVLLAVGCRFAELATGSYGIKVPENLIHIDINPEVFNKNYLAKVCIGSDSKLALTEILKKLPPQTAKKNNELFHQIARDKKDYLSSWLVNKKSNLVSPGHFFEVLNSRIKENDFVLADDGNHTFLWA